MLIPFIFWQLVTDNLDILSVKRKTINKNMSVAIARRFQDLI